MGTLTRDQQKVLRALGGWMLANLLIDPDRFKPALGGRSGCDALGDESHWLGFDGKGVRVGPLGEPIVEVRWNLARAHAKALSTPLRQALTRNRKAREAHMSSFKRWLPSDGDVEEWQRTVEHPYYAEKQRLNDELDHLLNEALPLADNLCRCSALKITHMPVPGMCDV